MLVTTVLDRQVMEVELLRQIRKILARRIADVGPNYDAENPGEVH